MLIIQAIYELTTYDLILESKIFLRDVKYFHATEIGYWFVQIAELKKKKKKNHKRNRQSSTEHGYSGIYFVTLVMRPCMRVSLV